MKKVTLSSIQVVYAALMACAYCIFNALLTLFTPQLRCCIHHLMITLAVSDHTIRYFSAAAIIFFFILHLPPPPLKLSLDPHMPWSHTLGKPTYLVASSKLRYPLMGCCPCSTCPQASTAQSRYRSIEAPALRVGTALVKVADAFYLWGGRSGRRMGTCHTCIGRKDGLRRT